MREITAEEIKYWDDHNDERNDHRYRKIEDCDSIMALSDDRQNQMRDSLTEVRTLLKVVIGILSAIGIAVLPVCVKFLFGG